MPKQKLYRNGNSIAVTIPKEYLSELDLDEGSEVLVVKDEGLDVISIYPTKKNDHSSKALTPEFKQWLDQVKAEHSKLIKELAKK